MPINDKIDTFMKENGYKNLKELALKSKIPYTTLRDLYEKKSADNSRLGTTRKLANFMKCTLDYLAYDEIIEFNDDLAKENQISNTENQFDELDVLWNKYKKFLTDDDKETMKFIFKKRMRDIDKQRKNN